MLSWLLRGGVRLRSWSASDAALELRVDAVGFAINVPIDHDAAAAVAGVPLGHQVLVPCAEFLGVRSGKLFMGGLPHVVYGEAIIPRGFNSFLGKSAAASYLIYRR